MPALKKIRAIVDRLKHLGSTLTLSASSTGTLTFALNAATADVKVHFHELENPPIGNEPGCMNNVCVRAWLCMD